MIFEVRRTLEGTWRALGTQFEGIWNPFGVQVALGVRLGRLKARSKGPKGAQEARQGGTQGAQGAGRAAHIATSTRGTSVPRGRPEASWQNIRIYIYDIMIYIYIYTPVCIYK